MNCLLDVLNNTFFGTLFAGLVLGYFGLYLYRQQKQEDLNFEDLKATREVAARLFTAIEVAKKKIDALFNVFGIKAFVNMRQQLEDNGITEHMVRQTSDELTKDSKEISALSENLFAKLKIRNLHNVDFDAMANNLVKLNLYLNGAHVIHKLKEVSVVDWRDGFNESKAIIDGELRKILM